MVPAALPAATRADPRRSAEVQVYDAIAGDPLLDGFLVLYSCEWVDHFDGLLRDGEADFVLAHPHVGYLVVEVKGGRVGRRVADGKWTTKDRHGDVHVISNPIAQALKSKKVILEALRRRWPKSGAAPFIWARHGVVMPHSARPPSPTAMGASAPPELLAFREDMPKLGAHLFRMLAWSREGATERPGGLGTTGIGLLEDFYGRDVDLSPRLKTLVDDSEAEILELTATQCRYLDFLATTRHALIEGGAGTGKTTLAVEWARRAAEAGRSVLLLCFNRPLARHIARELSASPASVATFHEFCGRMCASVGMDVDAARAGCDERTFWQRRMPEMLADVGLEQPPETYDDLIIDEGQDFRGEWIEALRLFLRPDASIFVFRDDFQNIYGGVDVAEALGATPMPLNENVRNTQEIFAAGCRFRRGSEQRCLGPRGEDVRWMECTPDRAPRSVERELNRLVTYEGFAPEDIAVLTGGAVEASALATETLGQHRFAGADAPEAGMVVRDSVRRFKGLDRPVVVLCEMDREREADLAYVALTRAKSLLVVIGDGATLDRLGRPVA
ncbi:MULTISPECIES: AAA family ATPase [unclassified Sphingomonas]|uniref:nuclease-related domain-containing DEAD/DEAH box helicase n=1 Tax=unclassified Sphingomonas TaxID=196159 RepID=UPI00226AF26B|nr:MULTISPECIES: AAA family ATPase [unclassified Sphingomonas]